MTSKEESVDGDMEVTTKCLRKKRERETRHSTQRDKLDNTMKSRSRCILDNEVEETEGDDASLLISLRCKLNGHSSIQQYHWLLESCFNQIALRICPQSLADLRDALLSSDSGLFRNEVQEAEGILPQAA